MNGRERVVECARCGRARPNSGRGLCHPCWKWARYHDVLIDHPRATWSGADLLDAAAIIRARHDYTWREVAATIGVRFATLDRARSRSAARLREL